MIQPQLLTQTNKTLSGKNWFIEKVDVGELEFNIKVILAGHPLCILSKLVE
ncbi:MAG: hypothetical protein VX924_03685 [Candidatus Neomarinimicrobiota bacterium]|nr:hypothetical protein [Candidatus Neomarinimicrobiota bacterium]